MNKSERGFYLPQAKQILETNDLVKKWQQFHNRQHLVPHCPYSTEH